MIHPTPHPFKNRTAATLNARIEGKLLVYASAAGAVCAGVALSALPAEGEIVFTPAHAFIATRHTLALDVNNDGIPDFTISNHAFRSVDLFGQTLRVLPTGTSQIAGFKGLINTLYASALAHGAVVGPKLSFKGYLMAASGMEYGYAGQWQNVTNRYLGLKFLINGQIHYGWARLTVTSGTGRINVQLTGYAYETIANRPIVAGQTTGTAPEAPQAHANPAPQQTMLGMLALGAPALSLWRRGDESPEAANSPD